MASWITDENGICHPAKERVALKNLSGKTITIKTKDVKGIEFTQEIPPGSDYIYEGPDRSALYDWWVQNGKPSKEKMKEMDGKVTIGENFRRNKEFLESFSVARQAFGFNKVDEYLEYLGYNEKKVKEEFEQKASAITVHDAPKRIEEIKKLGGGSNTANPHEVVFGGFGEPAELSNRA